MRSQLNFVVVALVTLAHGGTEVVRTQVSSLYRTIYVAPDGKTANSGDEASPLDLASALKPQRIPPGSTVLLRGGTYVGPFRSDLRGTEPSPITMRSAPGENAVITSYESRGDGGVLNVFGAWATYRDFEVTAASRDRLYGTKFRLMGLNILAPHTRFINLVIHDAGHGIGFWKEAVDSELYGNIIFNNGTENSESDMRHGHAIYTQNTEGEKVIRDNVMFDQFGWGIHAYPAPGGVTGFRIEGNVSFDNGLASHARQHYPNIMVSGHQPFKTDRVHVQNNYSYYRQGQTEAGKFSDANLCLGCSDAESNGDADVTGNYFVNGSPVMLANGWQHLTISGNTVVGDRRLISLNGSARESYTIDHNTYFSAAGAPFAWNGKELDPQAWLAATHDSNSSFHTGTPTGTAVFVRPNQYEPGRAHIIVFNWDHAPSVQADVRGVLHAGNHYRIFNVQDLGGRPVAEGTWSQGPISLPFGSSRVMLPMGEEKKLSPMDLSTDPEFGVFLLELAGTPESAPAYSGFMGSASGNPPPDPLAKLRPFEGEYTSEDAKARAAITADTSGLSIRILTEKDAPEYRITQQNGTRFRIEGLPAGFYVDFGVEGDRVRGITMIRGPLPKVYLAKQL